MTPTGWTREELDRIGSANELQVAARRADDTPRRPTPIWEISDSVTSRSPV